MEPNLNEIVLIQFFDTLTKKTSQPFQVPVKIRKNQLLELIERKSTLYLNGNIITHDLLAVLPKSFSKEETIIIKTSDESEQKAAVYCSSSFSGHESAVLAVCCEQNDVYTAGGDCTVRKWDFDMKFQKKTNKQHTHWVQVVKVFGELVLTGSVDSHVCVFDRDLNFLCSIIGHTKGITGIEKIGDHVVTSSRDKTVKFWKKSENSEKHEYNCVYSYAHDDIINGLYSHDQNVYSYSRDCTVKVYKGTVFLSELKTNSAINVLKVHGTDVFMGCEDGSIYKNNVVLVKQNNIISSLDISQNGIYLVTGSFSKKVCLYTMDGKFIADYMHFDSVYKVTIISNTIYSSSKDKTIKIYSIKNRKVISALICKDEVYDFALSGEKVVAACKDSKVYFFE